jgi:putative ABC transport system substrate-binding protein
MRRRELITLLGGAAAGWPLAAHAQQPTGMRRVGVLMAVAETDTEGQSWIRVFQQRLRDLGWPEGRVRIDIRFAGTDPDRIHLQAAELVRRVPASLLASADEVIE